MIRIHTLLLAVCFCIVSFAVHATPITYGLEFRVQYVNDQADSRLQLGNSYRGWVTIDNSILTTDGKNMAGAVSAFRIQMENIIWDLNGATPHNEFHGFRGPDGLGSFSPGFDVTTGRITNLRGGVYGETDYPFVDFSSDTRLPYDWTGSACGANTAYCGNSANAFSTRNALGTFGGSMMVFEIAEPQTLLLLLTAMLGLIVYRRKRGTAFRTRSRH